MHPARWSRLDQGLAIVGLAAAIVVALLVFPRKACGCGPPLTEQDRAQLAVKQLAYDAYPSWLAAHPAEQCPAPRALLQHMNTLTLGDPWGHDYIILCGDGVPSEAHGLGALSLGPDGVHGTADDIRSW